MGLPCSSLCGDLPGCSCGSGKEETRRPDAMPGRVLLSLLFPGHTIFVFIIFTVKILDLPPRSSSYSTLSPQSSRWQFCCTCVKSWFIGCGRGEWIQTMLPYPTSPRLEIFWAQVFWQWPSLHWRRLATRV